jgi:hypothetical protein
LDRAKQGDALNANNRIPISPNKNPWNNPYDDRGISDRNMRRDEPGVTGVPPYDRYPRRDWDER